MRGKVFLSLLRKCAVLTGATMLLSGNVLAQEPGPGPHYYVDATSGDHSEGELSDGIDEAILPVNLPSLDQIQPIEMPNDGINNPSGNYGVTFHNAETDTTIELPETPGVDHETFFQSLNPSYIGADGEISSEPLSALGNMTAAGSLVTYPARANVKLLIHYVDNNGNDLWSVCSGSMQDPGVVLTAAHCVYNRNASVNDWADEIFILPGWDGVGGLTNDEAQNWGLIRCTSYLAGTDYINNGNLDRDVAAIRITRGADKSRNIGMLTGWYSWASGGSCNTTTTYHNYSYPAEGPCHNGATMFYRFGTWDSCPNNQFQTNTTAACNNAVWGGMSGSGAYYIDNGNRYVHAICSTSNRSSWGRYCKIWSQFTSDLGAFETAIRGTTFDLELMRFRATGSTTVVAGQAMDNQCQVYVANATNANPGPANYILRVYLSTNNNISTADTLLGTWNYNNVDFAAIQGLTFNIPAPVIPSTVAPGSYYIGAVLASGTDAFAGNDDSDTWDAQRIDVLAAPPVNDDWANAITLGDLPETVTGNNRNATEQANEQDLGPAGSTVWWRFQAPADGTVTIDTEGSSFDTMLHVYRNGSAGFSNLIKVAEDDDGGTGTLSSVTFEAQLGEIYEVRVAGYSSAEGNIQLNADIVPCIADILVVGTELIVNGTPGPDSITVSPNFGGIVVDYNGCEHLFTQTIDLISITTGDGRDNIQVFANIETDIAAGRGFDTVWGGPNINTIRGGPGQDNLYGWDSVDIISGGLAKDIIYGYGGNDIISANEGADEVFGGSGSDEIRGGIGIDTLHGESGNDLILGGDGVDTIYGDAGIDTLIGNRGHDVLMGGTENDFFTGGEGRDFFDGGSGFDTAYDTGEAGEVSIEDHP